MSSIATTQTPTQRGSGTLVLGIGNILLRDEGIGVRVVEAMEDMSLPPGVECLDGATAGLDLLDALAHRDKVIVIDAVDGDYEPGTVMRLTPEDLLPREGPSPSLHDIGVMETLAIARQIGIAPREVVFFGIKPYRLGYGLDLSPQAAKLVSRIIELVVAELNASNNGKAGARK